MLQVDERLYFMGERILLLDERAVLRDEWERKDGNGLQVDLNFCKQSSYQHM
jgi:hypothetical protein